MQVRPLPKSLQEIAKTELNEDPEKTQEDIEHIREWLKKQPHLIARQDDYFLLCFLRGCKFSLQRAKEKLDCFYTFRTNVPEYFSNRDPFSPDIQIVLNAGGIIPLLKLPGLNESRVLLFRWPAFDPHVMPYSLLMKVAYMIIDILLQEDDYLLISGIHILAEYKDFPLGYITQFTPTALQKSLMVIQSGYPLRLKGMDIINVPAFFDKLYSIIKPALSPKFRDRTRVYSEKYETGVYKHIPQSILPKDYGGSEASLDELKDFWKRKVESYADWFKEDAKYYVNEKLRPEDSRNDTFGAEGTFRKLNID